MARKIPSGCGTGTISLQAYKLKRPPDPETKITNAIKENSIQDLIQTELKYKRKSQQGKPQDQDGRGAQAH